ncbi:S1C family serine protease [Deinococcus sp. QL22]|uniref:S1C family serine protease n=1 Tax=Deinococcus sp. QL22 TaxID=2939437 RepID=UPI002017BEA9|nr:trypsin-like peptidase domain-containing protein [Deinococcus sp. QL22]UQN04992.1 S1C family serine protease [Deinococcus sp. QL22]
MTSQNARVRPLALALSAALVGGFAVSSSSLALQAVPQVVQAQSAQPATPAERRAGNTPAPLTTTEKAALNALFSKSRAATLRIEQCPPTNCADSDGVGTAFLISADGLALTAYHVVFQAKNLSAQTVDKKRYAVEVIGYDDQSDLALLRVKVPKGTPFLPLAVTRPAVGDAALAIGNGGGAFLTSKTGRLTGLDSEAGRADFPAGTLELNAQLIPGDSGGPILNARGEVTGVVSYISVQGQGGIRRIQSYAVPVTTNDARVAALKRGEKRDAPIIGIAIGGTLAALTDLSASDFAEANRVLELDLGNTPGAFFTSVSVGSPAAKAGLQPLEYNEERKRIRGDIVTAVNGKRIVNFLEFQFAVRSYAPGDTVTLSVLRAGKPIEVKLVLTGRSTVAAN